MLHLLSHCREEEKPLKFSTNAPSLRTNSTHLIYSFIAILHINIKPDLLPHCPNTPNPVIHTEKITYIN